MENKQSVTSLVKEIKRKTQRTFSSEEKIKIVLERLRGEDPIKEIKYSIHESITSGARILLKQGKND